MLSSNGHLSLKEKTSETPGAAVTLRFPPGAIEHVAHLKTSLMANLDHSHNHHNVDIDSDNMITISNNNIDNNDNNNINDNNNNYNLDHLDRRSLVADPDSRPNFIC